MGRRWRWAAAALALPLSLVVLTGEPAVDRATSDLPGVGVRYTMWLAFGGSPPSEQDLQASAGHDAVVVLNSDRLEQAQTLRRLDPGIQLYQYRDLASVRGYDRSRATVTGVSFTQAAREGWLARDGRGEPIEWTPYPEHFQVRVDDPGYQQAWVRGVTAAAGRPPWNGVWADNDLVTLGYYSDATLAGSTGHADSDRRLRDGLAELIAQAGPLLNAEDRGLIVNISEGRNDHARWAEHARWGGGTVEHFMAWSRDGEPDITGEQWLAEAQLIGIGPRTLASTTVAAGDTRTCAYGYASFLMFASPGDGWQCAWDGRYDRRWHTPETDIPLGVPVGEAEQHDGAWTRRFQTGWAAVNPTRQAVTVQPPPGSRTLDGKRVDRVTLAPLTGVVTGLSN